MTTMISRCPLCQTAFRVTDAQLSAAAGLVRCGACSHVFEAQLQRVTVPGEPVKPAAPPDLDENYIQELFREEPAPAAVASHVSGETETQADTETQTQTAPEAVLQRQADEEPDAATQPGIDAAVAAAQPGADAEADAAAQAGFSAIDPSPVPSELASAPAPAPAPGLAPAFDPPPIEIESSATPRRRAMVWSLGSALAILVLLAQCVWHERDTLMHDERVRPMFGRVCASLGCQLPRYSAPGLIRSEGLVIRPAPDRPGVLLVDALLTNNAPYPQDWPGVEIVFHDMQGRVVAGRVFTAADYLSAPSALMPVRQATAVHLEIREPGRHATNYRLHLREMPVAGGRGGRRAP